MLRYASEWERSIEVYITIDKKKGQLKVIYAVISKTMFSKGPIPKHESKIKDGELNFGIRVVCSPSCKYFVKVLENRMRLDTSNNQ